MCDMEAQRVPVLLRNAVQKRYKVQFYVYNNKYYIGKMIARVEVILMPVMNKNYWFIYYIPTIAG